MSFIKYYWQGKGPLWKIYWLYGVLFSFAVAAVIAAAGLQHWVASPRLVALLIGLVIYTVWIEISVWRCADNIAGNPLGVKSAIWATLARWLTVAWAVNVLVLSILLIQMSTASWW